MSKNEEITALKEQLQALTERVVHLELLAYPPGNHSHFIPGAHFGPYAHQMPRDIPAAHGGTHAHTGCGGHEHPTFK